MASNSPDIAQEASEEAQLVTSLAKLQEMYLQVRIPCF